jgi:hypothetical protein
MTMDLTRRDAVIHLAMLMGATVVAPRLEAATFALQAHGFSAADIALLDEIGETIIPATDIPGAKAAGIGEFLAMMIADCYTPEEQQRIKDGIRQLDASYTQRFGATFTSGTAANRTALLNDLDREQREYHRNLASGAPAHYFRILKELSILGYFSSEIGATQALRYAEVPGGYDGNAPYKRGDRAWFN